MDPSQFLEEVNPIPPFSKVAFMFSILYLLLIDIWKKNPCSISNLMQEYIPLQQKGLQLPKGDKEVAAEKEFQRYFFYIGVYMSERWKNAKSFSSL